jgi:hypothetical protein
MLNDARASGPDCIFSRMRPAPAFTPTFGRKWPLIGFAFSVAVLLGLYWLSLNQQETYPFAWLAMSTVAGWSLPGVFYPPVFFAAGRYGAHLSMLHKIGAGLSAAAGFGVGMWLLFSLFPG